MSYPLPLTRTEAYLAYKAGVIQQSELKPSLAVPRIGIDAWLAYWTGLTNDYPKNPDGTPKMLQEEEKYIAYLCGVTDKYPEKCLRRVGAYLRYLISARWGRPDHPLNREELYLSLIKTQFIPSGNPSSDITIDGTAKAEFVDVKMYGDTFQHSYEGKNLFQIPDSITVNGVTLTKNLDGSFGLFGNATNDIEFAKVVPLNGSGIVAGQFTISSNELISENGISYFVHSSSSSGYWNKTLLAFTSAGTKTCAEPSTKYIKFVIKIVKGVTVNLSSIKTMIEPGSMASNYEPYVGGQASPSSEYPQPIQTVTGRQVVTVTGKNLFDGAVTHEFILEDGIVSDNDNWDLSGYIKVSPNTAYTVSYNESSEPLHTIVISEFNANKGFVSRNFYEGSTSYTFTTSATTEFIRFNYLNISKDTDFQIELGSAATDYEPYSHNDYEINLGKNLFNKNDVVNGIPSASDGSIISTSSVGRTSDYIPVVPNTTYSHTGHPQDWAVIAWYKADKSFIRRDDNVTTIASPSEAAYARVSCSQENLGTCQFEAGNPSSYSPYFEPIELCKFGDYQDYIWKDGEYWKVHKKITKYVCDSTLDWTWDASVPRLSANSVALGLHVMEPINVDTAVIGKSNKFVANSFKYVCTQKNNGFAYSPTGFISCVDKEWGSESEAKADILGSIFYFVLHGGYTTDITITETNLIAQLESLVAGGAENGTTYIKVSATEPNLPAKLYVEAPKYIE